jgi:SAM-dependent methyltransferase
VSFLGFRWRTRELRDRFYSPAFRGMYDRFLDTIVAHVRPEHTVLDAGCGSGRVFQHRLAGRVARVVGVDVTDEPRGNSNIDDAVKGDLRALPLAEERFDVAIVSHVAEHLTEPDLVFEQLAAALRPGGYLFVLTPNRWHYVALGARLLPHRAHLAFNAWRGLDTRDIFPTAYQANTERKLRALATGAGLDVERVDRFETEPEYLAFHTLTYAAGVAYERAVNRFDALAGLRVSLLLVARKPGP